VFFSPSQFNLYQAQYRKASEKKERDEGIGRKKTMGALSGIGSISNVVSWFVFRRRCRKILP